MERALRHSGFVARAEKKKQKTPNDFLSRAAVWSKMTGCLRRPTWLWSTTTETLNLFPCSALNPRRQLRVGEVWRGGGDCVTCSSFNHRADQTSDTDVNETRSRLLLSHRARSVGKPFPFLSETTHRGWSTCVTINVKVYYDCYGCHAVIFQNKMQAFDGFSFSNVKKMLLFLVLHYSILSFFKFWTICWTKEDFL